MPQVTFWPQWLDTVLLDDSSRGQAYEQLNEAEKASIKNALAFHYTCLNTFSHYVYSEKHFSAYSQKEISIPYEKVVFLMSHSFSPARFLSAIMPALVGKVDLALCFEEVPSLALCASIELAGIENVYILSSTNKEKNFFSLVDALKSTSLLLVFCGDFPQYTALAKTFSIPYMICGSAPVIYTKKISKLLTFCQNEAEFISDLTYRALPDIAYGDEFAKDSTLYSSLFLIEKGLECCMPSYFQVKDFFITQTLLTFIDEE